MTATSTRTPVLGAMTTKQVNGIGEVLIDEEGQEEGGKKLLDVILMEDFWMF